MDLIATKKLRYDGRSLKPGEAFTASNRDGRLLVGIKKAKEAPVRPAAPPEDDLAGLRATARRLSISVDLRWGARRLREEIAAKRA